MAVIYSVRRRKLAPDVAEFGFPSVDRGRRSGLSCGCGGGGGLSRAWIAIQIIGSSAYVDTAFHLPGPLPTNMIKIHIPDSSPSKTPGNPIKSIGIPSSASASMLSGCSRASRDAKPVEVYCPLANPVLGISSNFGGNGGGGRAFE